MDFAQEQRKPTKHLVGIAFVILLHVGIVYALVNGLARKVVEIIQKPLETKIVEEIKPPPPPEELPPPPPKMDAPPPPTFIPPPEVAVTPPPTQTNAISTPTTPVKPEAPVPIPAPHSDAQPAPAAPTISASCNNAGDVGDSMRDKFSVIADKEGISTGKLFAVVTLGAGGEVKDVVVKSATNQGLAALARRALSTLKCKGNGREVAIPYEVSFKLDD
jgi:protein TonB